MKKTLGEVGSKPSLADVDLTKIKPTHVVLTLDECLTDCKRLMNMFFNNEFEPAVEGIQYYSETSVFHAMALSLLHFLQMMLTMSKKQMDIAVVQVAKTLSKIEKQRYQRSYRNLVLKPNYNNFTDQQCQAEITYVLTNLIYGSLIALRDQSVMGFINAGYKVNIAYRTLGECMNIRKHKNNWACDMAKKDFNSMCNVTEGGFEIFLSMFPAKLAKLLEYIGFNCNQKHALTLISESCRNTELLTFLPSSFILTCYYGAIEYIYGLGEKTHLDDMGKYCSSAIKMCPNGAITHLICGITEMNKANFNVAVHCFRRVIDEQDYWPQLHFLAHLFLCLCYAVLDDLDKALLSAARLRDKCKWSSSLFYYAHSMFLKLKIRNQTPEEQAETRKLISEQLKLVPSLKQKLGGIHVFHEEISITRSKKYHDKIDDFILPQCELYYFWNIYKMMEDNGTYLENILNSTKVELDLLRKDTDGKFVNQDGYYYLMFHKAMCLLHLRKTNEAETILRDIIKNEKALKFNSYLVPISWFELSRIKYDQGDSKESKKCLKKVDSFSGYFGEGLISYRVNLMHEKIKADKKV